MLLSGYPPFFDPNRNLKRLHKLIKRGKFRFTSPHWDHISYYAKDLITHLLVVDPTERFDARQVLTHKWICKERIRKGRRAMDHIVSFLFLLFLPALLFVFLYSLFSFMN